MFGLKQEELDAIRQCLETTPQISKAIVYGSRAKGTFKIGSDIDLCIIGDLDYGGLMKLENRIDDLMLPYKTDLVLKTTIDNPALLEHIERVGKLFYEREGKEN